MHLLTRNRIAIFETKSKHLKVQHSFKRVFLVSCQCAPAQTLLILWGSLGSLGLASFSSVRTAGRWQGGRPKPRGINDSW